MQKRGDGDLTLHPGEWRAEAMVYAATPEGQVLVGVPTEVEGVGLVEVPLVAVGRTEDSEHEFSAGDFRSRYFEVLPGVALGRDLDRRCVP